MNDAINTNELTSLEIEKVYYAQVRGTDRRVAVKVKSEKAPGTYNALRLRDGKMMVVRAKNCAISNF